MQVRYAGKNAKNEVEIIEWNFTCETTHLAQEWMRLIDEEKNKLVNQLTGEKNSGFIHDTLIDALARSREEAPKETILKPEEQVIKTVPLQEQPANVHNSRFSVPKKYEPPLQKSELRQSHMEGLNLVENSVIRNPRSQNNESRLYV